ncbi:Uncharacterised protein [uncultured archaeon]|nr:Uncharacterised protein [uncultured archaeon]
MIEDLGHLGPQDANGAVVCGEDIGEQSHVAADGRASLHQIDVVSRIGQIQGSGDSCDSAANDQHLFADGNALRLQRSQERSFRHCHGDEVLGLFCGHRWLVHVHPGALLPDVGHLQHVGIEASLRYGAAKGGLVQSRRACGDHNPVKLVFGYILLDLLLADVGA